MGFLTDILKEIPVNAVLRGKLEDLEKKYEKLVAENVELKGENQELKRKVEELTGRNKLCENEVNILKLLSSSGRELTAEIIAGRLGLNPTKAEYYLERMGDQYISPAYLVGAPAKYSLAQKGREFLIENSLLE